MKFQSMLRNFGGAMALTLVLAMAAPNTWAQAADSDEISNLLAQAKSHAALADDDAAKLESYTRSKLAWRTHAIKLDEIKQHVNELLKVDAQLNDLRGQGSPWQQDAINQIDVHLKELAALLTTTINHLNDNKSRVHMQAFRDYAESNHDLIAKISAMINDYVDYDKAKSKAELLEQKLELPAPSGAE